MRPLFLGIALFALLGAIAFAPRLVIAGPAESSVWIEVERDSGVVFKGYRLPREGEGMGVVVSRTEVFTAAHVVFGATKIKLVDATGMAFTAEIVSIDYDVDIAILRIDRLFQDFAYIRSRPAAPSERVSVVPLSRLSGEQTLSSGTIGTVHFTSHGVPVPLIFSGIKGEKGQSGGGLFDDKGYLVGIIIRIDARLSYLSALPAQELCTRFSRCPVEVR